MVFSWIFFWFSISRFDCRRILNHCMFFLQSTSCYNLVASWHLGYHWYLEFYLPIAIHGKSRNSLVDAVLGKREEFGTQELSSADLGRLGRALWKDGRYGAPKIGNRKHKPMLDNRKPWWMSEIYNLVQYHLGDVYYEGDGIKIGLSLQ